MVVDGDPALVNERTVAIASEYGCNMVVSSPGTPQENRKAERKVRQVLELARAMMLGAPHLPTSAWGSAELYTEYVNEAIPKCERCNYMSPYEMN